jgi:hypothetical protein
MMSTIWQICHLWCCGRSVTYSPNPLNREEFLILWSLIYDYDCIIYDYDYNSCINIHAMERSKYDHFFHIDCCHIVRWTMTTGTSGASRGWTSKNAFRLVAARKIHLPFSSSWKRRRDELPSRLFSSPDRVGVGTGRGAGAIQFAVPHFIATGWEGPKFLVIEAIWIVGMSITRGPFLTNSVWGQI